MVSAKKRRVEEPKQDSPPVKSEEEEEEEEEDDDEVEYEEASSEEEEESKESEESRESEDDDEGSKRDSIRKLLRPFGKDQLIEIIKEAAANNSSIITDIIAVAESDPVHRKIFVHGLGWDITNESLLPAFKKYGEIDKVNVVTDKNTGRSKGYGFVLFKTRAGARKALKQPQKKIGNRMTACQLASAGPVASNPAQDASGNKLYISNVGPQISLENLKGYFAKFGEIEEGPFGQDKLTGKFRGFAIIVYKTAEGIKKALEDPIKTLDGCKLQCSRASTAKNTTSGPVTGGSSAAATPNTLAFPVPSYQVGLNMAQNFSPATVLVGQNPAFGVLNPMFAAGGFPPSFPAHMGLTPSFPGGVPHSVDRGTMQPSINTISPSIIGSYAGLGAYQSSYQGQSPTSAAAATRTNSGVGSYFGR